MTIRKTLKVAGLAAWIGFLGTTVAFAFCAFMGVSFTVLLVDGRQGRPPGWAAIAAASTVAAFALAVAIYRQWNRWTVLEVFDDGSWRLKNFAGVTLARLMPGDRQVEVVTSQEWNLVGSIRRTRPSWAIVHAPAGSWRSWTSDPSISGLVAGIPRA